jgi:hypothetical protein
VWVGFYGLVGVGMWCVYGLCVVVLLGLWVGFR